MGVLVTRHDSRSEEHVVHVAPAQILAPLEASHDRMLGGVTVLGGVLARRLIAAADVPALLAQPEMHPAHARRCGRHGSWSGTRDTEWGGKSGPTAGTRYSGTPATARARSPTWRCSLRTGSAWRWRGSNLHALIANRIIDAYLGIRSPVPIAEALRADSASLKRDRDERAQMEAGRVQGTKPSRTLDDYAGTYGDRLFGPVVVRREAGGLSIQMGQGLVANLTHWHYDTFLTSWRSPRHREDWRELATFALEAGHPASLSMVFGRDTIIVKRTEAR